VRALAVHPSKPEIVYAGTQSGAYRSGDHGEHWERVAMPDHGLPVWSVLFHPHNPDTILVGTENCEIYRSDAAGERWTRLPVSVRFPEITTRPDSFKLEYWYTVGDPQKPERFEALLTDKHSDVPQKVSNLVGKAFGTDEELQKGYLAGFMIRFNSKAREKKTGQVVVGNGQLRLVVISNESDDDTMAVQATTKLPALSMPTDGSCSIRGELAILNSPRRFLSPVYIWP